MDTNRPKPSKVRYKYSAGIALCRYNHKKHKIEMVMVKKRCTYWFTTFILGFYNSNDDRRLIYMFSRMTPEEKLVILTLDFEMMWNHNWQTHNENPKFKRKKIADFEYYKERRLKFERLIGDHGKRLRRLIANSKSSGLIWEIPKGRKQFPHENDIECAIREFEEETGITKNAFQIIPDVKPFKLTFRDGLTYYVCTYYLAKPIKPIRLRINFDMLEQICEVIDIRWCTSEEADLLNCVRFKFVKQIYDMARKKIKC